MSAFRKTVCRRGTVRRSRSFPGDYRTGQPSGGLAPSSTPVAIAQPVADRAGARSALNSSNARHDVPNPRSPAGCSTNVSSRLSPRSSRRGTKAANARGGVSGRLKVGAPVLFASYYVAPIVSRFLMLYPNVEVELKASDEQVDLLAAAWAWRRQSPYDGPPAADHRRCCRLLTRTWRNYKIPCRFCGRDGRRRPFPSAAARAGISGR
jgi:hypothetical protein